MNESPSRRAAGPAAPSTNGKEAPHMRKFKTESKKLLDLMINSIYTNREIFLRELISNASDAVDKLYFKSLTDSSIAADEGSSFGIDVAFDKDARTITVSDNGIGMTQGGAGSATWAPSPIPAPWPVQAGERRAAGRRRRHHRPVRRGLLLRVHGGQSPCAWCRSAYGSDEAWAWESDGVEGYTIEEARARGQRHRHHPDPEGQHRRRELRPVPQRVRPEGPHQTL